MNVNALKALYVALGGSLTDSYGTIADGVPVEEYVLNADVVLAIAEIASNLSGGTVPSGPQLPAVTAADDGKVLTVVGGQWAAATP